MKPDKKKFKINNNYPKKERIFPKRKKKQKYSTLDNYYMSLFKIFIIFKRNIYS